MAACGAQQLWVAQAEESQLVIWAVHRHISEPEMLGKGVELWARSLHGHTSEQKPFEFLGDSSPTY